MGKSLLVIAVLIAAAVTIAHANQCKNLLYTGQTCSDSTCRKDLFSGRWYNCDDVQPAFRAEISVTNDQCAIKCADLPGCTRFTTYDNNVCNLFVTGTPDGECPSFLSTSNSRTFELVPCPPPAPTLAKCVGSCVNYQCPAIISLWGGTIHVNVEGSNVPQVWGSNPYAEDSVIGTAALHATQLTLGQTGIVAVQCIGTA
jgi:hypothetical protein